MVIVIGRFQSGYHRLARLDLAQDNLLLDALEIVTGVASTIARGPSQTERLQDGDASPRSAPWATARTMGSETVIALPRPRWA